MQKNQLSGRPRCAAAASPDMPCRPQETSVSLPPQPRIKQGFPHTHTLHTYGRNKKGGKYRIGDSWVPVTQRQNVLTINPRRTSPMDQNPCLIEPTSSFMWIKRINGSIMFFRKHKKNTQAIVLWFSWLWRYIPTHIPTHANPLFLLSFP